MQPIFRCKFPDPSSSHSQPRPRPGCPPTRNGLAACWRWTGRVCPAESQGGHRGYQGLGTSRLPRVYGRDRGAKAACRGVWARLCRLGGMAGGAHVKHRAHVRNAGGVPAQRLVELVRVLPRVASRAYGAGRAAGGEAGGGRRRATAVHAACRGERDCRYGAGHGEERTENIWNMVVTLEVSKLSGWLNALAFCQIERRAYGAG